MNAEELSLIRSAKAGDDDAWRELLATFELALQKFVNQAVRFGRDEDDAWSRCHEVFVRCVRTFDETRGLKFSTLVFTALARVPAAAMQRGGIHVPVSAHRTHPAACRAARRSRSMDARSPRTRKSLHDCIGCDGQEYSDLPEIVSAAVDQLRDRDRTIVRLRMSGFSHKEIGALEDISQQRSFQIEARAHRQLRDMLEGVAL